jgi:hypothetical protein
MQSAKSALGSGSTDEQIIAGLLGSPEFAAHPGV